jgi:trimeric autotransporter adhesin
MKTTMKIPYGTIALLALNCFALLSTAQAVNPPPDGGYPGQNTAEGDSALLSLTNGNDNTGIGFEALESNTTGVENTATGAYALQQNRANYNTANGAFALFNNTGGVDNTATGSGALGSNTTGNDNTANGFNALLSNRVGVENTANGAFALQNNTGSQNTANGYNALFSNTSGGLNTATGITALYNNANGSYNTATGAASLGANISGNNNTATGMGALDGNTNGSGNTANGNFALNHNTNGGNNTALGYLAGSNLTTGSNNIDIGANVFGTASEANTIRIGKQGTQRQTFVAGISGVVVSGSTVVVNSSGKLGVAASSVRFKEAIKPMDKASEAILALKPVTFRYKQEIDPDGIPQFGLVAEQVERVNPDLVARDEQGKPYTVRYEAVNAMLLNEFLKEHGKVQEQNCKLQEQETTITQLKQEMGVVAARLKEQDSKIQKVSARIELSKLAPQLVTTIRLQSQ